MLDVRIIQTGQISSLLHLSAMCVENGPPLSIHQQLHRFLQLQVFHADVDLHQCATMASIGGEQTKYHQPYLGL